MTLTSPQATAVRYKCYNAENGARQAL